MKLSTVVCCIALIGGAAWYKYPQWYPLVFATRPTFPVDHTLQDRTGRAVPARLLARNGSQVRFVRTTDGTTYDYPIASLADEDQQFVRQFPESTLRPLAATPAATRSESLVVSRLRAERAELENKIKLMELELELEKKDNKSPVLPRDEIYRRIHESRNRIIDIDKQLLEISFRSGAN